MDEQNNRVLELKISDLMGYRQSGVYCVKNQLKKYIQIYASRNMLDSINNLYKEIDYTPLKNDMNDLCLEILEISGDTKYLKVLQSKWIEYYKKLGYSFYKEYNLVNYKLYDGAIKVNQTLYYSVYLQNKRRDKIILGIFSTKIDAIKWKNNSYPDDIIVNLVFADNEFTYKVNILNK